MPSTIACPTCGADGTSAANDAIAQSLASLPPPTSSGRVRLAIPTAAHPAGSADAPPRRPRPTVLPGQADRTQAQYEARAKISWGDPPKEVTGYLMGQGFSYQEASDLVNELTRERALVIRAN